MPDVSKETEDYPPAGKYITIRGKGFIAHYSPDFIMTWQGREYRFEWGRYGGPVRLKKGGDPYDRQPGERHPFWDGIAAWVDAGRRADKDGRCILVDQNSGHAIDKVG